MTTQAGLGSVFTEGVRRAALYSGKSISLIHEEIASATGYSPHAIAKWRKGQIPHHRVEAICRYFHSIGVIDVTWLSRFLTAANFYEPDRLASELFPHADANQAEFHRNSSNPDVQDMLVTIPDVSNFAGRKHELFKLSQWIETDRCRLICVFGTEGIGKTVFVAKVIELVKLKFQRIEWRSLLFPISLEHLLLGLRNSAGNEQTSQSSPALHELVSGFLIELQRTQNLIIIDHVDSLLESSVMAGYFKEQFADYRLFIRAIQEANSQSTVIIVSRDKLQEFAVYERPLGPIRSMELVGLGAGDAINLLLENDLTAPESDLARLIAEYSGNPKILELAAKTIKHEFGGQVLAFLSSRMYIFGEIENLLTEQFIRLTHVEQTILYWLMIWSEPTSVDELDDDMYPPSSPGELMDALDSLQNRSLIERSTNGYAVSQLIASYLEHRFIKLFVNDILQGSGALMATHCLVHQNLSRASRLDRMQRLVNPIVFRLVRLRGLKEAVGHLELLRNRPDRSSSGQGLYVANNVDILLERLSADLSITD